MRDDLRGRWSSPRRLILGRMRVADERRVVAPGKGSMEGRTDARIRLRADDHEPPHAEVGEHDLECRALEGVAVLLLDQRLGIVRDELGDDPPRIAPAHEAVVVVLNPDHGDTFVSRPLDEAAHVRDDSVALVRSLDDAVLHVDDARRGGGADSFLLYNLSTGSTTPITGAIRGRRATVTAPIAQLGGPTTASLGRVSAYFRAEPIGGRTGNADRAATTGPTMYFCLTDRKPRPKWGPCIWPGQVR